MGRGKASPHRKQLREDGLPESHADYCFMAIEDKPLATILVAKETTSNMVMAPMVPMKGASIEFSVKRCLSFLKEIGLENADVVLKSDQENSIMDVLNNVAKRRSANSKLELLEGRGIQSAGPQGRSIPEASPVGSSGRMESSSEQFKQSRFKRGPSSSCWNPGLELKSRVTTT